MPRLARLAVVAALPIAAAVAAPPRANPPTFSDNDRAAFFDDAFSALVGERPDYQNAADAPQSSAEGPAKGDGGALAWSSIVDADTLETEIKRQAKRLTAATRSPAAFKAGGFREADDALGLVALLMAVTADHGGEPRWRDDAAALRDWFAAARPLVAEDAAFATAAARAADLADLVRGGRPAMPKPASTTDWEALVDRGGIMRRMELADEGRLRGWVTDRRAFRRNADDARHEAQVLALLSEAICRPGAPDADGEDYAGFGAQLTRAATAVSDAAEAGDQDAARAALPAVDRACADCHADYRG